ncbi:AsmA family protein [Alkalilimnicola ehrlichii MLHE-1]|uniref:Uncharacterized protein involved in outer membrane biogenesis-like protein n=1 Tax=Alkalilimnicola ehrlichii (strain ATCC BAA-1101 / DSM 17681 / MLHE-1) TaxID=187272 RepID=Q0A7Q8_ALKEH|nr:AsmA family protein [Alkalilimnicola ehrlichii]ABI57129.1 Uncharacterized protein involved in outer membrane biogenesis-like protein [Alkalilimnicola ehrlichii MLHE-1]
MYLAGVLVAVLVLAGVALALLWPGERLGEQIAGEMEAQLGVPVSIEGDATLRLWPGPAVRVSDVLLGPEPDADPVGHLAAARLSVRWLPLLRGRLEPGTLLLDTPVLNLERDAAGALNVDWRQAEDADGRALALDLRIRGGELHWRDEGQDQTVTVRGLEVDAPATEWRVAADDAQPLTRLALGANVSAERVEVGVLGFDDVAFGLSARDGVIRTEDWEMTLFGSRGTGEAEADFTEAPPHWVLNVAFGDLQLESFPEAWLPAGAASGSAELTASLTSQGEDAQALLRHLHGEVVLSGHDLLIRGVDLDEELAAYERTQRFSLVDAAAVVLVGPGWLAATKGTDFARLAGRANGETEIVQLLSAWQIENGVAHSRDVALATPRNRLAAQAALELPERRIREAEVAVVDGDGCALMRQEVHGSFDAPEIEEPHFLEVLLGAPLDLLKRGLDALSISPEDCEVFYEGDVAAP